MALHVAPEATVPPRFQPQPVHGHRQPITPFETIVRKQPGATPAEPVQAPERTAAGAPPPPPRAPVTPPPPRTHAPARTAALEPPRETTQPVQDLLRQAAGRQVLRGGAPAAPRPGPLEAAAPRPAPTPIQEPPRVIAPAAPRPAPRIVELGPEIAQVTARTRFVAATAERAARSEGGPGVPRQPHPLIDLNA